MDYHKEEKIFEDYIRSKNLKHSSQRSNILKIFLEIDRHLSADELYRVVKQRYSYIGYATVYRTLRLLCDCGLSRELRFEDGTNRYEHLYGHKHHDHLICTRCGKFVEVVDSDIELLQERLIKRHGFYPEKHKMELYGICKTCRERR